MPWGGDAPPAVDDLADRCLAHADALGQAVTADTERLEEFFEPRNVGHAESLIPMIRSAMSGAGIDFEHLDRIAVTHGPGSTAGTRLGIATARALHVSTGIPLVSASSLAVMAEEASEALREERGGAALGVAVEAGPEAIGTAGAGGKDGGDGGSEGKGGATFVYVQWFGDGGRFPRTEPQLLTAAAAAALVDDAELLIVGSGAEAVAAAARRAGRKAVSRLPRQQPDACALTFMAQHLPFSDTLAEPLELTATGTPPPPTAPGS